MGMGEPLDNYEELVVVLRGLTQQTMFDLAFDKITVSTVRNRRDMTCYRYAGMYARDVAILPVIRGATAAVSPGAASARNDAPSSSTSLPALTVPRGVLILLHFTGHPVPIIRSALCLRHAAGRGGGRHAQAIGRVPAGRAMRRKTHERDVLETATARGDSDAWCMRTLIHFGFSFRVGVS
eukprot:511013-Prorocentrum_minimum.AAC.1